MGSLSKQILVLGGRQIGKSRTFIRKQIDEEVLRGRRAAYACPSLEIADNNWMDIANAFSDLKSPNIRVNKVERGIIEINDGARKGIYKRIIAHGQRRGSNVRGAKYHSVFDDELHVVANSKKYWAISRALTLTTSGKIYLALTAPSNAAEYYSSPWIANMLEAAGLLEPNGTERAGENLHVPGYPGWHMIRQPTTIESLWPILRAVAISNEEPSAEKRTRRYWERMAEDTLSAIRNEIGEPDFLREYLCAWFIDTSGLVFESFSDKVVSVDAEYDPTLPVYWALDRGEGEAYTVIVFFHRLSFVDARGMTRVRYIVFDELISRNRLIDEDEWIAEGLKFSTDPAYVPNVQCAESERRRPYRLPDTTFPDPRATGFVDALRKVGMQLVNYATHVEPTVTRINRYMRQELFVVNPRCKLLLSNFHNWTKDDRGFIPDSSDQSDAAQAIGYGVMNSERFFRDVSTATEESRAILGTSGESVLTLAL